MAWQEQLALELRRPSSLDEPQVKIFVRPVNFVAHNRVPNRRKMDSNLVSAPRMWNRAD